jgi:hypothetical protein
VQLSICCLGCIVKLEQPLEQQQAGTRLYSRGRAAGVSQRMHILAVMFWRVCFGGYACLGLYAKHRGSPA